MENPLYRTGEAAKLACQDKTGWRERKLISAGCARGFRAVACWYERIGETEMAALLRLDLARFYRGE